MLGNVKTMPKKKKSGKSKSSKAKHPAPCTVTIEEEAPKPQTASNFHLYRAIHKGNVKAIKKLAPSPENLNLPRGDDFMEQGKVIYESWITPLLAAIMEGNLPVVACLVELGADINYCTDSRYYKALSSLHVAILRTPAPESITLSEYLLKHGATVDAVCKNSEGTEEFTPLSMLIMHYPAQAKTVAATEIMEQLIDSLLKSSASPNAPASCNPAIFWAAQYKLNHILGKFLDYGGDLFTLYPMSLGNTILYSDGVHTIKSPSLCSPLQIIVGLKNNELVYSLFAKKSLTITDCFDILEQCGEEELYHRYTINHLILATIAQNEELALWLLNNDRCAALHYVNIDSKVISALVLALEWDLKQVTEILLEQVLQLEPGKLRTIHLYSAFRACLMSSNLERLSFLLDHIDLDAEVPLEVVKMENILYNRSISIANYSFAELKDIAYDVTSAPMSMRQYLFSRDDFLPIVNSLSEGKSLALTPFPRGYLANTTPLYVSIESRAIATSRYLLSLGACPFNPAPKCSPLDRLTMLGLIDDAMKIFPPDNKIKFDFANQHLLSTISSVLYNMDFKFIEFFISHGFSIEMPLNKTTLPALDELLFLAKEIELPLKFIQLLFQTTSKEFLNDYSKGSTFATRFHLAILNTSEEIVECFLQVGINPDIVMNSDDLIHPTTAWHTALSVYDEKPQMLALLAKYHCALAPAELEQLQQGKNIKPIIESNPEFAD